jgi:predicted secreted protein
MAAVDAFGTVWAMDPAGGITYTDVADVTEIGVLDLSAETIETTVHGSASGFRTFIGGLKDGGELKMSINYDPANHGTIFTALGEDTSHEITLTDAGAAIITFDGIVTGLSVGAPMDDKLTGEVTIKVTGVPVITP